MAIDDRPSTAGWFYRFVFLILTMYMWSCESVCDIVHRMQLQSRVLYKNWTAEAEPGA